MQVLKTLNWRKVVVRQLAKCQNKYFMFSNKHNCVKTTKNRVPTTSLVKLVKLDEKLANKVQQNPTILS